MIYRKSDAKTPEDLEALRKYNRESVAKYSKTPKGVEARKRGNYNLNLRRRRDPTYKAKYKKYQSIWLRNNPDKVALNAKRALLKRHNLTIEKYDELLAKQNDLCSLCGKPETDDDNFVIDHDHNRCNDAYSCDKCFCGIIHNKCNRGIGQLGDDLDTVTKACAYLIKTRIGKNEEIIMSCFRKQTTELNDASMICDALKSMGYKPEENKEKVGVRGHYGETQKAEIVLKKEDLKDGGDIGFSKDKDGTYSVVADTYVLHKIKLDKFVKEVNTNYNIAKAKKIARAAGLEFLGMKDVTRNGKTVKQLQWNYVGK